MRVSHPFSLPAVLALAACGGSGPAATTPAAGATGAPAAVTAAASAGPFRDMTKDQKVHHMKTVIQPTMGQIFKAYDGQRYGEFGCASCHGEKKEDPHKALPKLALSGDGFKKLLAEKPAMMKFMGEQVVPAMAKAMGEKPFDPTTHQGFGCGGCHTVQ